MGPLHFFLVSIRPQAKGVDWMVYAAFKIRCVVVTQNVQEPSSWKQPLIVSDLVDSIQGLHLIGQALVTLLDHVNTAAQCLSRIQGAD